MESIIEFKDVSKEFEGNVVLQYSEATLADWLCFTADRFISYHER